MVRIDGLIFGYRRITVKPSSAAKLSTRLLHLGISVKIDRGGAFTIRERDRAKTLSALSGIEYTESECLGLLGAYKKIKNKPLVFSAIVLSVAITLLSSSVVWDVRIDGNRTLTDAEITSELQTCGLGVGDFWENIDRSRVETELLSTSEKIAWVNINRRGSVAYVTVVEKEDRDKEEITETSGYANVVAEADCIIEEITVTRGRAVVKQGDVVKRGDLLISGTLPEEAGGGFCYAEGVVIGRMTDTVTVSVGREYEKKSEKSKKISSISLKIFDLSANIFKSYRNLDSECDIIKEIKTFSLFGKARLPLEISLDYATEYDSELLEHTDTELVSIAAARLSILTDARLCSSDLLKIRTSGSFTDTGYVMSNDLVFTTDVGVPLEFSVE